MTPFDRFRQHVQDQPDEVAVITPYRVASYRKMWSRIERSTARLQAEWGILPGDTIAYLGCGHLDALVMYFAAARCGARLLPLEHAALQSAAPGLVAAAGCVLVLHDDARDIDARLFAGRAPGQPAVACRPLSSLIATPCRHREAVTENSATVSLLQWPQAQALQTGGAAPDISLLQDRSLDQLAAEAAGATRNTADVASIVGSRSFRHAMFDAAIFGPIVLATLLAGQTLRIDAA
jgi:acyl-CoA synthetase (AMP-forming)/AMP-acid ligase II